MNQTKLTRNWRRLHFKKMTAFYWFAEKVLGQKANDEVTITYVLLRYLVAPKGTYWMFGWRFLFWKSKRESPQ